MIDYKLTQTGMVTRTITLDTDDGPVVVVSSIPPDPGNRDYQEYLSWVADGNEADPADPDPEPETPVASILMLMLQDVTDVDETKPILEAMLMLLGGIPEEA